MSNLSTLPTQTNSQCSHMFIRLEDAATPWIDLDDEGEELDFPIDSGEPV